MATYRQLHLRMWKDVWFMNLKPAWKLLFVYLFSNERSHLSGVYELPFQVILWETGLRPKLVREALAYFQASGKVCYNEEHGHVFVRNLMRYNARNVMSTRILAHLRKHREAGETNMAYWAMWEETYPEVADRVSMPCPQEQEQEKEKEKEQQQEASRRACKTPAGTGAADASGSRPAVRVAESPGAASSPSGTGAACTASSGGGDGGSGGSGIQKVVDLLELAGREGINALDRQRIAELIAAADEHRSTMRRCSPGADRSGAEWVCEAVRVANGAQKRSSPLSLNFVESVLRRWYDEGFQAPWGGEQKVIFEDVEYWEDDL